VNSGNESLKPYLYRSAAVHGGILLAFGMLAGRSSVVSNEVYRIDFIGPSNVIINRNPEASGGAAGGATAAGGRLAPESQPDEFATGRRHSAFLNSTFSKQPAEEPVDHNVTKANSGSAATPGAGAEASVSADMPNFPFPWYISQIRAALWNQWSSKLSGQGQEATVEFSIMRDGSAVDIRIETSSGDSELDFIALGAVQSAMPFPPLPPGYSEKFLKVHVRFKS
jgi:TonB family protein